MHKLYDFYSEIIRGPNSNLDLANQPNRQSSTNIACEQRDNYCLCWSHSDQRLHYWPFGLNKNFSACFTTNLTYIFVTHLNTFPILNPAGWERLTVDCFEQNIGQ